MQALTCAHTHKNVNTHAHTKKICTWPWTSVDCIEFFFLHSLLFFLIFKFLGEQWRNLFCIWLSQYFQSHRVWRTLIFFVTFRRAAPYAGCSGCRMRNAGWGQSGFSILAPAQSHATDVGVDTALFFKIWVPKHFSIFRTFYLHTVCIPIHTHTNFCGSR